MMQNPFDQFDAPVKSGPILGPAPRVDPYKARDQQLQEAAAANAAAAEERAAAKFQRETAEWQAVHDPDGTKKVAEGKPMPAWAANPYEKNVGIYAGLAGAVNSFNDDFAGNTITGGLENSIQGVSSTFGTEGQRDWWASFRRNDNIIRNELFGATLTPSEQAAYASTSINERMDPKEIRRNLITRQDIIRKALTRKTNFLKAQGYSDEAIQALAGEFAPEFGAAPSQWDKQRGANRPEMRGDVPVGTEVTFGDQDGGGFDRGAYLRNLGIDPNQEASVMAFYNANRGNPNLTAESVLKFYADAGATPPSPADILKAIEDAKAGKAFGPIDTSQAEADYRAKVEQAAGNDAGFGTRADTGITSGLSDEAAGVGGAIGSALRGDNIAEGYRFSRDVERQRQQQADANTGLAGDAVEIGSSMLLPFGAARTAGQAARVGATAGAVGGFGYGEGAKGSGLNALLGAGAGAALGAGAQKVGNALATRAANRAAQGQNTNALLQAADNLQIDRPGRMFTDPTLQNRTRAVAGTIAGGAKVQGGVRKLGSDIEGSVSALSPGNAIADNEAAGGVVRNAAERFIKTSGAAARKQYDQAERLAGDAKMPATEGLKIIDELQARLGELPNENKAELAYLSGLREDLSKNVSVGALRDLRTTLRKKISKGELTFGQNEQRVLDIMKATSADIENGLRSNGNSKAAAIFSAADKKYAERMDYIKNTLQKVIGKRNSGLSNEDVFRKLRSLTKADSASLRKFYTTLSPDEAADVSATFAEALGRGGSNGTKDFSTATLIDNIEALKKSGSSIETMFGPQGAKALKDIELLAREHKRVNGAIAGQGSAQGNDWRWTLASMFIPGVGGLATSGSSSAIAAGVAGLVVKAGRDAISAKMLLSPKITNWARVAPRTNSPKAINAHWDKLSAIAKAEPALAADIDAFRNAIMQAANDNANKAVAEDSKSESMR